MRTQRNALLCLAAVAAVSLAPLGGALAQKYNSRIDSIHTKPPINRIGGGTRVGGGGPRVGGGGTRVGGGKDGGYRSGGGDRGGGGGYRGPGIGMAVPIIMALPPSGGQFIDDGSVNDNPRRAQRPQRSARRGPSGAPPANERRLVPDEVVIEVPNTVSAQQINALQNRHRLTRLESQVSQLSGSTRYRWRIPDRRSVTTVVRALEGENANLVAFAQPNYLFALQQGEAKAATAPTVTPELSEGDPAQYELAKLRLPQAHMLAKGGNVLVAVIDSAIDPAHPDLAGVIADSLDTLSAPAVPHTHGTAIAGLIAAHGKLMGAAPGARILAVRAFDPNGSSADATTFNILKGLDWAAAHNARVINMSFAGPSDPAIHRSLEAAHKKGIVLIAAAGNAGAKSPPLYPAAEPTVIAVSATDADDKLFEQSNRGRHIAIAAPGNQILVAVPGGSYEQSSGTSYSAAEISGIVALMLERRNDLTPDQVRGVLTATAKDLGPKGPDAMFGAGLADAFGALTTEAAPPAPAPVAASAKRRPPVERVSTGAR